MLRVLGAERRLAEETKNGERGDPAEGVENKHDIIEVELEWVLQVFGTTMNE